MLRPGHYPRAAELDGGDLKSPEIPWSVRVPGVRRDVRVKIASRPAEWEAAFALLAKQYQARGYEPRNGHDLRFTPYHALADTVVYVAREGERVLATVSVVPDNAVLGLPMESVYGEEIAALRRAERSLNEVTSLGDVDLGPREFAAVFLTLIRLLAQHAVGRGAPTAVISVHPRHRAFYRKVMGFVPLGPCRPYPNVQDHPAEAYVCDPEMMRANAPATHRRVFGEPLPAQALAAAPIPEPLVRAFAGRSGPLPTAVLDDILARRRACGS
jgi:hypothetical protein